jgi:uncharacterized protein (TIGR02598 family)
VRTQTGVGCGFSLVEVTLALGVAAVSLLAIFALLPIGLKTNQVAIEQRASTDVLSAVIADLHATPVTNPRGGATTSPRFAVGIPANPVSSFTTVTLFFNTEGQCSTDLEGSTKPDNSNWHPPLQARYRATITFVTNGTDARNATFVNLKATWPAAAGLANAGGSAEMFVALDRN